jgi:hypothetical protein
VPQEEEVDAPCGVCGSTEGMFDNPVRKRLLPLRACGGREIEAACLRCCAPASDSLIPLSPPPPSPPSPCAAHLLRWL